MKDSFIEYRRPPVNEQEMEARAEAFQALMRSRRSVRDFSSREVPKRLIELAIETAASAPSGANRQPWKFVVIGDPELKRQIRVAAEAEEKRSYEERMPDEWLEALSPLGTGWRKPFLETVPWLVVVFSESYGLGGAGEKIKNYYVQESVGIACGLFIAALHNMGLSTVTHTPSPMGFLSEILERPRNERPYILFPVGYPAAGAQVPNIDKKNLAEVSVWKE